MLKKGQVSLKDIDVTNIPEFVDVIIDPREKEVVLLGRRLEADRGVVEGQAGSVDRFTHSVQAATFEEQSYQEFRDKHAFVFDPDFRVASFKDRIGHIVRQAPFLLLFWCFFQTAFEYLEAKSPSLLLEEQELQSLETLKANSLRRIKMKGSAEALLANISY